MTPGEIVISVRMKRARIGEHPYFAKRTKKGKPYKRRQRILRRLRARGLTSYYAQEITTTEGTE